MTATMTRTAARTVNRRIRALRRERREWLAGQGLPWGTPWCSGPGSPGHQPQACEGCATAAYARDRASEILVRIRGLETLLTPAGKPVQEALW